MEQKGVERAKVKRSVREEALCGICHEALTPALLARRGVCGAYNHEACLASLDACPACGQRLEAKNAVPGS